MTTKKFLNLTLLQPGDVILTAERTLTSRVITIVQRVIHFDFRNPGFSHAILVVAPLLWFDTTGQRGARFTRIKATRLSEDAGLLQLWLDVSKYRKIAVVRFITEGNVPHPLDMLDSCMEENISAYPSVKAFLPIAHSWIRRTFGLLGFGKIFEYQEKEQKFCSSLVAQILLKFQKISFRRFSAGQLSPFLLFDKSKSQQLVSNLDAVEPHEKILGSQLGRAQAISGHGSRIDPDKFSRGLEDIHSAVSRGTLVKPLLINDPAYHVSFQGKAVSMIEFPELTQYESLRSNIENAVDFFAELARQSKCFMNCDKCINAVSCHVETSRLYEVQKLQHSHKLS